jgi:uncharacterized membrane protein
MASNRRLILIIIFFLALAGWQSLYFYPRLPDQIATHYGVAGEPDDFTSKKTALILNFTLFCLLNGMFFGMAWLTKKVPENLLNIPNKDFWLKPENKPRAMELIFGFGLKIGIVTDLFLLILFQHIYAINIDSAKFNSGRFWIGLFIYFVAIGLMIWQLYQIFQNRQHVKSFHRSN